VVIFLKNHRIIYNYLRKNEKKRADHIDSYLIFALIGIRKSIINHVQVHRKFAIITHTRTDTYIHTYTERDINSRVNVILVHKPLFIRTSYVFIFLFPYHRVCDMHLRISPRRLIVHKIDPRLLPFRQEGRDREKETEYETEEKR